jgi:DNA mismatch repair protein MSH3
LCLFITHYQSLAGVSRGFEEGGELRNVHMKFTATNPGARGRSEDSEDDGEEGLDGDEEITFLYEVGEGVAHRSYGLNVARLARVPKAVLETAALKSRELEMEVKQKKLASLSAMMSDVLDGGAEQIEQLIVGMEEL